MAMPSDLEIARAAHLDPIGEVAARAGIGEEHLELYGREVAKVGLGVIDANADHPRAKYVVVTAITPTPLGEGKTTTAVGIGQGLARIGKRSMLALRQPSMGPTFGIKGGAARARPRPRRPPASGQHHHTPPGNTQTPPPRVLGVVF